MEASTPRPDLRRFAVGGAQLNIRMRTVMGMAMMMMITTMTTVNDDMNDETINCIYEDIDQDDMTMKCR